MTVGARVEWRQGRGGGPTPVRPRSPWPSMLSKGYTCDLGGKLRRRPFCGGPDARLFASSIRVAYPCRCRTRCAVRRWYTRLLHSLLRCRRKLEIMQVANY
eukprot:1311870-Pleurochrysis_carterae.AAC.2